jgi:hypothetical protein
MSNHLKMCSCKSCRAGATAPAASLGQAGARKLRHGAKDALTKERSRPTRPAYRIRIDPSHHPDVKGGYSRHYHHDRAVESLIANRASWENRNHQHKEHNHENHHNLNGIRKARPDPPGFVASGPGSTAGVKRGQRVKGVKPGALDAGRLERLGAWALGDSLAGNTPAAALGPVDSRAGKRPPPGRLGPVDSRAGNTPPLDAGRRRSTPAARRRPLDAGRAARRRAAGRWTWGRAGPGPPAGRRWTWGKPAALGPPRGRPGAPGRRLTRESR